MEIAPHNVFPPHLLQAGFEDWSWHVESYSMSVRDALRIWDTASIGRKVQCGLKRGRKWSLSIGAAGGGVVPPAPLGLVLTWVAAPAVRA